MSAQAPVLYLATSLKGFAAKIKSWASLYKEAVQAVGSPFPWQTLAGVHYRESEFDGKGDGIEGPFGLDQGGTADQAQQLNDAYTREVCVKCGVSYAPVFASTFIGALVCAYEIKFKVRTSLYPAGATADMVCLADAVWGYNGRSIHHNAKEQGWGETQTPEWTYSPYVSNDPANGHQLYLVVPGQRVSQVVNGERVVIADGKKDQRPGALVIIREVMARNDLG